MSETPPEPPRVIPPENLASPGELDWPADVPWWKPGFAESLRYVGWRWILILPAIAVILLLILSPFNPFVWQYMLIGGGKLLILIIGAPFALAGRAFSQAVKARKDPFCMHCGYGLTGLPDLHRCPECGQPYSFKLIEEYRRDPNWFIQRWKQRHQVPVHDVPFQAGPSTGKRKSRDGT